MPTFYNFRENGLNYSFDDIFVPADLFRDGNLWVWGNGGNGALGNARTTRTISTPITTFAGGTNWKQVSAGLLNHSAAIKTDGTLWIWGGGNNRQLGNATILDTVSTPITTFAGGTNWKQVSLGRDYTSAIKTDGTLWTWGLGNYGILGTNDIISRSTPVTTFAGGTNWKQMSAGQFHIAAIKTDGTLWSWGTAGFGVLGDNNLLFRNTPVTTFAGGNNWEDIDRDLYTINAGNLYAAAIKTDGTLWLWGSGISGKLGNADTINVSTPVTTFAGGTNWKQISTGTFHTAAIKTDGTLWTWGRGQYGRLGNAVTTDVSTPVTTFAGGTNWKQVSGGQFHTAAIKTDGTLWTWGSDGNGRLGNADTTKSIISTPITTFTGGTNWKQVSTATFHTAAIKTDGTLWTWGNGTSGQLGKTFSGTFIYTPVTTFAGGTNWADTPTTNSEDLYTLSAGTNHTAAIKTDGTLWTWGWGNNGRLGNTIISNIVFTPITTFTGGTNWKQISAGNGHTAAIKTDGTLWTWGYGNSGRLGNAVTTDVSTPVTTFSGGTDWKQVGSAGQHTAAIKTNGTLWTWGNGTNGQLGNASTTLINSTPVTTFTGGTNWKQVSAGGSLTAAIKTDGTLWVWGNAYSGQLGDANIIDKSTPVTTFAGGTNWKQVSAGDFNSIVALRDDGVNKELFVWGSNDNSGSNIGRLGINSYDGNHIPIQIHQKTSDWKQVSAGNQNTAAIKTDGTLWAWGNGGSGRLGNANTSSKILTPITTFTGGTNWKQVSAGDNYTAAIKTDGTLWTWGSGGSGRLGDGSTTGTISTPITTFVGGTNWKQVSGGDSHTIALKDNGSLNEELFVWGNGGSGKLGNAVTTNTSTPVTTFTGGTNWRDVEGKAEDLYTLSAGIDATTAVKTDGTLWTWGNAAYGRLGNGEVVSAFTNIRSTPITTFAGGTNWKQVSAGSVHMAAIKTDGTLWAWGAGTAGQLGTNDLTNRSTPVTTFAGGTTWKQASGGNSHTAAIKTDGTLWAWGSGSNGKLGNAVTTNVSTPVTTFSGGTDWKQVSCGYRNSAAIKTDGTLWVWGSGDSGVLGNGVTTFTVTVSTPITTFAGGTDWKQVSFGGSKIAAIKTNGTLWVWGNGRFGQLGNADTTNRSTPVTTFAGGTNWKQVNCGVFSADHTAAIKTDGTLWTWGYGYSGQLGNASVDNVSTPVTTFAGGTNWQQVSCGTDHTVALRYNGVNKELFTWGTTTVGHLGAGESSTWKQTPVTTFAGGTNWKQVSGGSNNTTAIKTDGTLWTWGYNRFGRLGNANTISIATPITTFAGGTNWKQASISAAIKTDGTLWTWGAGSYGRLGNANTLNVSTPITTFAGGTDWKQVSAGGNNGIAAIKTDGTLWTWGRNIDGRLGNGSTFFGGISTPVTTFVGGTKWKEVSGRGPHNLALTYEDPVI